MSKQGYRSDGQRRRRLLALTFCSLLCANPFAMGEEPVAASAKSDSSNVAVDDKPIAAGHKYALLVGCTEYDNNRSFRLVGPGNDVELFQQLLLDKFKFAAANVVVLSEKAGGQFRPTQANIAREFAELAAKARSGDQVVVLLGGHGSQQPEQDPPDPNYPKPDGRDQIFLPADIGVWQGGKEHRVAHAIPDYELRKWTKAITATGASLWLIVDSCCSGATLRGGGETVRKVTPSALGISDEEFAAAADRAKLRGGTRGGQASELRHELDDQSPNFVALYAARPDEPTVESPLPGDGDNSKVHGLLTYTLCEILERSSGDLTYAELHKLIASRYVQLGRSTFPEPLIEGLSRGRQVLGTRVPGRSPFSLVADPAGGWKLNAGRLQGLTQGSMLTVYPPRDRPNAEQSIGHVRIRRADTLDAAVVPCEYDNQPAPNPADLLAGARCELAFLDYGPMRLRLAVDKAVDQASGPATSSTATFNHATPNDAALIDLAAQLTEIENDLREMTKKPTSLLTLVEMTDKPDWVVQARAGEIALIAADAANVQGSLPPRAPRFPLPKRQVGKALEEYASRIFRARNLLRLTSQSTDIPHPALGADGLAQDDATISVEVEMLKFRDTDGKLGTPLHADAGELVVPSGQNVGWRITNHSRFKVDVTLLFVDSEYGIAALFPRAGSAVDNMLPPGGHILTMRATTTPTTFDLDQIVTIAVKSAGQPLDFSVLEQTNLDAVRKSLRGAGDPTLDSPLGQLCQHALYGAGGTRGLSMDTNVETQQISLMSWRVK